MVAGYSVHTVYHQVWCTGTKKLVVVVFYLRDSNALPILTSFFTTFRLQSSNHQKTQT